MVLKELGIERFEFTCGHCGFRWEVDYDVQHVEDGYGHALDYYSVNGLPAAAPVVPGALRCPKCGATRLRIQLLARRPIPVAPAEHEEPLATPTSEQWRAARDRAPLLDAHRPSEKGAAAPRSAPPTRPPPP
jgi:hypothetical protein